MPYIIQTQRDQLDPTINNLSDLISSISYNKDINPSGLINYTITKIIMDSCDIRNNPTYNQFNSAIGVLECAKQELYRRAVAVYEDKKISSNGDVF